MTSRLPGSAEPGYDFSESTALVTGAAGDFGGAVALRLGRAGARLALADLESTRDTLEKAALACTKAGATQVEIATFDVTDRARVTGAVEDIVHRVGVPRLVFNNAGYQGRFVNIADYPHDDARRVLDINVMGVLNVLQAAANALRVAGVGGSIVNSASMAGVSGAANMPAYCASKGAVIALTRAASKDLAPLGIRVNAISPAFIGPGAMWEHQVRQQAQAASQYYSSDPATVAAEMVGQIPLRRLGSSDEVAAAAVWLLSDDASYITGENLLVTGGIV